MPDFAQAIENDQGADRIAEEAFNSIKFDNDIDLDREKTREQLGFRDQDKAAASQPQKKISMKERFAAAQAEADRRNGSYAPDQPQHDNPNERGGI